MIQRKVKDGANFYLVGGGIASLAAAAFLIRDGNVSGRSIHILEESPSLGGSLDAGGNARDGYSMRGGRMLESKYVCTFDLFSSIPSLDNRGTVAEETFAWNRTMKTMSRSRLFRDGKPVKAPLFGLKERHILTIERLVVEPEVLLGRTRIQDQVDADFFQTDFWLLWCTTFAFQPWHSAIEFKRYLVRFLHMVSGFSTLSGIMRTVYNQYDSMVRPLRKWLEERGVQFEFGVRVTDLPLDHGADGYSVVRILFERGGERQEILLGDKDVVIVTLGSMTDDSTVGSIDRAPLSSSGQSSSWSLWNKIADGQEDCGHPANFSAHPDESKWVSFTTTLNDPTFFDYVRDQTGNAPGEGGLITFPQSSWLASIVLPHQPHFMNQPSDVQVFWGYGLSVDRRGDFVKKPMHACTGREIMREIMGHLRMHSEAEHVLDTCVCIPCMMPFITSQFLCRGTGDRPEVLPARSKNMAFIGQFCELPDDVVFTVEYSIRSAQTAVYALLGLDKKAPSVYKGHQDVRVLLEAFRALHKSAA